MQRTRKCDGEIVNRLEHSNYYPLGICTVETGEAIVRDQKCVLPVIANINGEYGFNDIFAGVPVILRKNGVEKVLEVVLLKDEEPQAPQISLIGVKKVINMMQSLLNE